MKVLVIGAGVAGLCCALELSQAGAQVEIVDRAQGLEKAGCSWFAGGMLAPYCEGENTHALVTSLGTLAQSWWRRNLPSELYCQFGTLVLAPERDREELLHFASRTEGYQRIGEEKLAALEPELAAGFREGLFFDSEAHLDPRLALKELCSRVRELGTVIHFGMDSDSYTGDAKFTIDCRGLAARDSLPDLRGVKGEMLLVRCPELRLGRPVRLLHPRRSLYVVPRDDGVFMVGATVIESDDRRRIGARSMVELLQGAYALHPAFGEAEIVEIGTEVRPAFLDNLPKIRRRGKTIFVNGLYRHGFLLAPILAEWVRKWAESGVLPEVPGSEEVMNEDSMQ